MIKKHFLCLFATKCDNIFTGTEFYPEKFCLLIGTFVLLFSQTFSTALFCLFSGISDYFAIFYFKHKSLLRFLDLEANKLTEKMLQIIKNHDYKTKYRACTIL
jgi:hypothetical protein